MSATTHPLAPQHLPYFLPRPGEMDYLLVATAIFLLVFVLALGLIYLRLHALPDHIAHKSQKVQYQLVCALCLLAMFTHVNAFWVAGLLLAIVDIPDLVTPLRRMTRALQSLARSRPRPRENDIIRLSAAAKAAEGPRDPPGIAADALASSIVAPLASNPPSKPAT